MPPSTADAAGIPKPGRGRLGRSIPVLAGAVIAAAGLALSAGTIRGS